ILRAPEADADLLEARERDRGERHRLTPGAGGAWSSREREAPPLEDQEPVRALSDDLVGGAGRKLALNRLRRLAPDEHALDEHLGRRLGDPIHRAAPRRSARRGARAPGGLGLLRPLLHGGYATPLVSRPRRLPLRRRV